MSKVPVGKVLLRNVIRHTDAHNKIQEESEMWKLRGLERQTSSTHLPKNRGRMHCDRHLDSEGSTRDRLGERLSERDEEAARYWTRKLYEFEAKDPDRWGHSGFKELYPEEFQSDGDKYCRDRKHRRKKHKNKLDADMDKNAKKSSKKKKKKKEKKRTTTVESGPESGSDAEDSMRKQRRKRGKSKRRKKEHKSKERTEDSSTEDSQSDRAAGKQTKTHRKRDGTKTDTLSEPQRKKRKNWRVANEERSEESSDA